MRKEKGFEVADKINLYVADNDMLISVIEKFKDTIKKDTLTVEIIIGAERDYTETVINGEKLKLDVEINK